MRNTNNQHVSRTPISGLKKEKTHDWAQWLVVAVLVLAVVVTGIVSAVLKEATFKDWIASFLQNMSAGFVGAGFTYWLIEILVGNSRRKAELINKLYSRSTDVSVDALQQLHDRGWLKDGSLENMVLMGVQLPEAAFSLAQLEWTELSLCKLNKCSFFLSNFSNACFASSDLEGSKFEGVELYGTDFRNANLKGVVFENCSCDQFTRLPDGTYWATENDWTHFTDPTHPQFWSWEKPHDE